MEHRCRLITLERTPERLDAFRRHNPTTDFDITVVHGIDGRGLDRPALVRDGLVSPGLDWSDGAVGAALSHRELWLECVRDGVPVVALEDDVHLVRDARRTMESIAEDLGGWDILFLGFNTDSCLEVRLFEDLHLRGHFSVAYPSEAQIRRYRAAAAARHPVRVHGLFGLCGYALTPGGARRLLAHCFLLRRTPVAIPALGRTIQASSLDALMNACLPSCAAYAVLPPLVLTGNDPATSSTRI